MNAKQIIVSGIIAGIVILVVSMTFSMLSQSIFNYDVLKLDGMRSVNDPIMLLFFLHYFVIGFAITILYSFARKSFTGNAMQNGIALGILGWIVGSIPSAFVVFSSMSYPLGFTINSVIGSFVYMLAAGITVAKLSD